jgi:hypothetical protein
MEGLFFVILKPLSARLYIWKKECEGLHKSTDLSEVTRKLYNMMVYLVFLAVCENRKCSFSSDRYWLRLCIFEKKNVEH